MSSQVARLSRSSVLVPALALMVAACSGSSGVGWTAIPSVENGTGASVEAVATDGTRFVAVGQVPESGDDESCRRLVFDRRPDVGCRLRPGQLLGASDAERRARAGRLHGRRQWLRCRRVRWKRRLAVDGRDGVARGRRDRPGPRHRAGVRDGRGGRARLACGRVRPAPGGNRCPAGGHLGVAGWIVLGRGHRTRRLGRDEAGRGSRRVRPRGLPDPRSRVGLAGRWPSSCGLDVDGRHDLDTRSPTIRRSRTVPWMASSRGRTADVAVGRDGQGAAAWTSADGISWTKAPTGPGFGGAVMTAVTVRDGHFSAVGSDGSGALAWSSPDGLSWTLDASGDAYAGDKALGVAAGSTATVAVGSSRDGAAIWSAAH